MTTSNSPPTDDQLFELVDRRTEVVREFLDWALTHDRPGDSLRWDDRPDIEDARQAAGWFVEPWWGVVVFTCFGHLNGTREVAPYFPSPIPAAEAISLLAGFGFSRRPVIGHHRIQATIKGAKTALASACEQSDRFRAVLLGGGGFDERFALLRDLPARQWGRTTCFDLLLRSGAIGIGGCGYAPESAHLAGSTGPQAGFLRVFGIRVTGDNAAWCESLLRRWSQNWEAVAELVGVEWSGPPYRPGDYENALCIFQERR